jgi:hypothetical protein
MSQERRIVRKGVRYRSGVELTDHVPSQHGILLELSPRQLFGKGANLFVITADCRACQKKLGFIARERKLETAHQERYINPLGTGISVCFVENNKTESLLSKNSIVFRPEKQILQHREIRQKNVWRMFANFLSTEPFIRSEHLL